MRCRPCPQGRQEFLSTAYSDHDLFVLLEVAGVTDPEATRSGWSGAAATPTNPAPPDVRAAAEGLPGRGGYSQGFGSACHRALSQSGGLVRNLSTIRSVMERAAP